MIQLPEYEILWLTSDFVCHSVGHFTCLRMCVCVCVGKKKKKGKETPSPQEEEKPATPVESAQPADADAEQKEEEDGDEADNKPTTVRMWILKFVPQQSVVQCLQFLFDIVICFIKFCLFINTSLSLFLCFIILLLLEHNTEYIREHQNTCLKFTHIYSSMNAHMHVYTLSLMCVCVYVHMQVYGHMIMCAYVILLLTCFSYNCNLFRHLLYMYRVHQYIVFVLLYSVHHFVCQCH